MGVEIGVFFLLRHDRASDHTSGPGAASSGTGCLCHVPSRVHVQRRVPSVTVCPRAVPRVCLSELR